MPKLKLKPKRRLPIVYPQNTRHQLPEGLLAPGTPATPATLPTGSQGSATWPMAWRALSPSASSSDQDLSTPPQQATSSLSVDPAWSHLVVIPHAVGSQMEALSAALSDGFRPQQPIAAVALEGKGFRGQRGRPWVADRGNLFFSAVIPLNSAHSSSQKSPQSCANRHACLQMLPTLAALRAASDVFGLPQHLNPAWAPPPTLPQAQASAEPSQALALKWVNDLLFGGCKVGGGLVFLTDLGPSQGAFATLGLGINLAVPPHVPRAPDTPPASALGQVSPLAGTPKGWNMFLEALLNHLGQLLPAIDACDPHTPSPIYTGYSSHLAGVGKPIRLWGEEKQKAHDGVLVGVQPDLGLCLAGETKPHHHGRLQLLAEI